jgi:hypothetical protein
MQPNPSWKRFHEPMGRTLARNIAIAVVVGASLAFRKRDLGLLASLSVLALWFSLGGHYVEVVFLNEIRSRIPGIRLTHICVRLAVWFVGGATLYVLMAITARVLPIRPPRLGLWWFGGLLLIGVELMAHGALALRRLPNFYSGSG